MKKSYHIGTYLSSRETVSGFCYFAFQLLLLPAVLQWINGQMADPLSEAELNFVYYLVNFLSVLLIFHDFLGRSGRQVGQHPIYVGEALVLGFVGYYAMNFAIEWIMEQFLPSFSNYNDAAIADMLRGNYFLMFIGTVILVPPVEECFFRGLIFRNLYPKSKWAAYIVSILAFACIHIIGYIGRYSALELLIAVIQYLPAGLCLAWSYVRSDTIFAPILIHAAINYVGITRLR